LKRCRWYTLCEATENGTNLHVPRPFICSKKFRLRTERIKKTDFQRLDVGSGGDHIDRDSDAMHVPYQMLEPDEIIGGRRTSGKLLFVFE